MEIFWQGSVFVSGPGSTAQGSGFRVQGSGFRVQGSYLKPLDDACSRVLSKDYQTKSIDSSGVPADRKYKGAII